MARAGKNSYYDLNRSFLDSSQNLYPKEVAKSLRLWCRMNPGNPTDLGPEKLSPVYKNSPSVQEITFGSKGYPAVTFSNSLNQAASVVSTDGFLSFSISPSDISPLAPSDLSFSISLWVKVNSLSSTSYLFFKRSGIFADFEYGAWIETDGKIYFALYDVPEGVQPIVETDMSIVVGDWYHLTFTYDGVGGSTAADGLKIYVNGVSQSLTATNSSDYKGMTPSYNEPLLIGQNVNYTNEINGQIAEFSVWGSELSSDEIVSIYNVTRKGAHFLSSGILSNPARILLQQRDNKTGSYPTIARTGDPDFTGNYSVFYDDTNTINFVGNNQTVYPTALPGISKWVSGGIATPNILQGLVTNGTASKGVADSQISFTPGQNISPFNENRIYIDNDSTFYQTGTDQNVLPGFNQRLGSKTSITIDINPVMQTSVAFSTGSNHVAGNSQNVNSGIAYFNFQNKKWEVIGNLTTGSNVDIINYDENIRRRGLLAFAPSGLNQLITTDDALASYVGLPVNNFGFPFSAKYDATGSQLYCMSSSINHPFLVEKIVIEFSASFGPEYIYNQYWGPCVKQFFLINQFDNTNNSSLNPLEFTNYFAGSSADSVSLSAKQILTQSLGKTKDLIGVGEISLIPSASNVMQDPKVTNSTWLRDLNIVRNSSNSGNSDFPRYNAITGSYRLEFEPRVYPNQSVLGAIPLSKNGDRNTFNGADPTRPGESYSSYREVAGSFFSGRRLTNESSGNSFIKSVAGVKPSGSAPTTAVGNLYRAGSNVMLPVPKVFISDLRAASPYILTPQSKILIGYANTPNFIANGFQSYFENGNLTEGIVANAKTVLSPGIGKITLFGSLLQNNLPVDNVNNQPLTSDAIHEDLHYDNPVFDQFDVEPTRAFFGSYIDNIITGSMLVTPIADPTAANVRKVQASVAAGQAGTTGSLQRFIKLNSENDAYYDSLTRFFTGSNNKSLLNIGNYGLTDAKDKHVALRFRRDRYGQYRDMLEFSPNVSLFVPPRTVERPVEINFYSRQSADGKGSEITSAEKTHTQNTSPFATSSLPYFDGQAVERSDNPDITVQDIYVG